MNYDEMKNALYMKNQLIFLNKKELVERYSGIYYKIFLNMARDLLNSDSVFVAAFNEAGSKLEEVISSNRYKDRKNFQLENEIIITLNELKTIDQQESREIYRELNENIRMSLLREDEEFLKKIGSDILLVFALEEDSDNINMNKDAFISSTAYLLETFREVYIKNPRALEKTKNYLVELKNDKNVFTRRKVKVLNKELKRI